MKKLLILILLIFSISITSCSGFHQDEILIGFAGSLEYSYGNLGIDSMYGVKLAVDEINEAGGINGKTLRLVIKDDERNSEKAVSVDNELKELGVVAIIGHGYSSLADSIIDNSTTNNILLISPTISTDHISGIDDLFIRITPSTKDQGYSIANAMNENSPGDVLIVYEGSNDAFSNNLLSSFVEKYTELGNTVSDQNIYNFSIHQLSDYNSVADEINNSSISNILTIGSAFDVANIIQKVENPENYNFYFPSWIGTSDVLRLAGPKINNSILFNYYDFDSNNYSLVQFGNKYLEEFGVNYSYSSILGYESLYLLATALEETTDWSPTGLKDYIVSKTVYSGLIEDYYMNEYGDVKRTIYYTQIIGGEFVTIGSDVYA